MASIEPRGGNKYRIIVSLGRDRYGKKLTSKKPVEVPENLTELQKEKWLQKEAILFEEEVKKGAHLDHNITFEKFASRWLIDYAQKQLEDKTIKSYKDELETKILPAIGHIKLVDLQPLHLNKFYDQLTQDGIRLDGKPGGYSTRTIQYQHQIVSSILQTAVYWMVTKENITDRVKPPKGEKMPKKRNYFTLEETVLFLEAIKDQPLIYKTLAYTTLFSGLRLGEALALNWNDVDFDKNTISISKALSYVNGTVAIKAPKNESSIRVVTIPKAVTRLFRELKQETNSIKVFDLHYNTPYHWLQKIIKKNPPLPKITFHGLRHTNATLLISQNNDIRTVSGRLGHSKTSTTLDIYSHFLQTNDKIAAESLSKLLSNQE